MSTDSIDVAVGVVGGKVVLKFPHAVEYVEMDAQNTLDIAEEMSRCAFLLRDEVPAAGPTLKASMVERHHQTLVPRVTLMLASLRADAATSDGEVAAAVVEACLREVF